MIQTLSTVMQLFKDSNFSIWVLLKDISDPGLLMFRAVADPRNSGISAKYREIHEKYFQIHVGKTYLVLILAIRPFLFTANVQIYLETSSLQRVNNVLNLPGVLR